MNKEATRKIDSEGNAKKLEAKIKKAEMKLMSTATQSGQEKAEKKINKLKAQLAWQYLDDHEFEKASEIYDKLPQAAHSIDRYCGMARVLIETGKYAEAEKLLDKALKEFPDYVPVLNTYGILYNTMGNAYEALRYLDRAIAVVPQNNPWSLQNKAGTLKRLKYHEEAFKIWNELIAIFHDDPYYVYERGFCQFQRGNYAEAIEDLRQALKQGYESSDVYVSLCKAYSALDCAYEAFSLALEAVDSLPETAELYRYIGVGQLYLEQPVEAITAFQKGLSLEPDSELFKDLIRMVEEAEKPGSQSKKQNKPGRDQNG